MESVRVLRSKLTVSQEKFARLLGISFVSVNKWENNKSVPTGLSAVLLTLLENTLRIHLPSKVTRSLQDANGDSLTIIRVLVKMESENG